MVTTADGYNISHSFQMQRIPTLRFLTSLGQELEVELALV
jgi:hypothetical protein